MASAGTVNLASIRNAAAGKAAAKVCLNDGSEADAVALLSHKNVFVQEGAAMALAEAYLASEREGEAIALLTHDGGVAAAAPEPGDPPMGMWHAGPAEALVVAYLAAGREADAVALLKHDDDGAKIGAARALVGAYMKAGREADVIALLKGEAEKCGEQTYVKGSGANIFEALAYEYAVANRDSDARALMESNDKPWQELCGGSAVFGAAEGLGRGLAIAGREADAEPIFDAYGENENCDGRMMIMAIAGALAKAYLMAGRDDDFKALLSRQGNMTDFKPKCIKNGASCGAEEIGLSSISDAFLGDLKWH
jgi:hypothetical protein